MLLRQTLLYLPAQIVGPIFQFISVVAWTHYLSPESMGVFALVTSTQELAYTVSLFWFTLYTMRYHDSAGDAAAKGRFLDTESAVLLASAVASVVMVLALVAAVETQWSTSLLLASIAYIVTRAIVTQFTDRARTEHDTLTYTVLQTVWPVLGLGIGIALVALVEQSTAMVLWGYTIAQVISLVVAAMRLEIGPKPLAFDRDMVRKALRYGTPLLAGGLFVWIASNGIRFVVEAHSGAAAVGLVTVGWALGLRAANFAAMLVTAAAFPLAVKRSREHGMDAGQQQLERNGVLLIAALLPAAVGLWAIAHPFVSLVVAEPYRDMTAAVLPAALLAGVLRNIRIHFGEQVFLLRETTIVPLYNDILDALASLAGVAIGLWLGGLEGSVIGAAIGALVSMIVTLACAWAWHRFTLPPLDVAKVVAATAVMGYAVTRLDITPGLASLALAGGTGVAVYAAALAVLYPQAVVQLLAMARGKPGGRTGTIEAQDRGPSA